MRNRIVIYKTEKNEKMDKKDEEILERGELIKNKQNRWKRTEKVKEEK